MIKAKELEFSEFRVFPSWISWSRDVESCFVVIKSHFNDFRSGKLNNIEP